MKKCGCFSVFSHSLSDPPGRRRGPDTPRFWKTPGLGASESEVGRSGEVATVRAFRSGRSLDYRVHALLLGQAEVKTTRIGPWSKMIFRFLIERFVNFPKIWWMLHRVYMTDVTTDFLFQLLHREWPGPCWDQKTSIMLIAWNSGHIMGYFFSMGSCIILRLDINSHCPSSVPTQKNVRKERFKYPEEFPIQTLDPTVTSMRMKRKT